MGNKDLYTVSVKSGVTIELAAVFKNEDIKFPNTKNPASVDVRLSEVERKKLAGRSGISVEESKRELKVA